MSEGAAKQKKGDAVTWVVRAGLLGLVVAVAVAIYLDSIARNNAVATTTAWLQALDSANAEERQLLSSDLLTHVVGDPEVTGSLSEGTATYTWSSLLRSFSTIIKAEPSGEEFIIIEINGPGS